MTKELLQQALEALEEHEYARTDKALRLGHAAIGAIREALAQPEKQSTSAVMDGMKSINRDAFKAWR